MTLQSFLKRYNGIFWIPYGTTLGELFSGEPIQFVYIVTNNVDPTPTMGSPQSVNGNKG